MKRIVVFDKNKKPEAYSSTADKSFVFFEAVNFSNLPINECATCKTEPRLRKMIRNDKRVRWFVECPFCKATGAVCKYPWKAVLLWNKSPNSIIPHYKEFWMFHLSKFDNPTDAHSWLCLVKSVLESRLADARKNSKSGRGFKKKLNAYLLLCDNAIMSCKYDGSVKLDKGKSYDDKKESRDE